MQGNVLAFCEDVDGCSYFKPATDLPHVCTRHDQLQLVWIARLNLSIMQMLQTFIPVRIQKFWSYINLQSGTHLLPHTVISILCYSALPFVMAGEFASKACGLLDKYDTIDLFTVVDVNSCYEICEKFMLWVRTEAQHLNVRMSYVEDTSLYTLQGHTHTTPCFCIQDSLGVRINIVFLKAITCDAVCYASMQCSEECFARSKDFAGSLQKNVLQMAKYIADLFTFDVCKCVGIPYLEYAGKSVDKVLFLSFSHSKLFSLAEVLQVSNIEDAVVRMSFADSREQHQCESMC